MYRGLAPHKITSMPGVYTIKAACGFSFPPPVRLGPIMREEDENTMKTLREVILSVQKFPSVWLFLPKEETWTLDSRALVAAMEEVPPADEDLEDAGYPEAAKINNLMAALNIRSVEEVVFNARAQKPDAKAEDLLEAFLYYYDFDAFIDFTT